jgi:hypothetical protein
MPGEAERARFSIFRMGRQGIGFWYDKFRMKGK